MDQPPYNSLLAALEAGPDDRQARGKRYPWVFLLSSICGDLLGRLPRPQGAAPRAGLASC